MLVCPTNFEVYDTNLVASGSQSLQQMMPLVWPFGHPIRLLQHENSHAEDLMSASLRR